MDQSNPEEKASQIRYMQDIYANAKQLNVWLGEESEDSDLGLEFARTIAGLVLQNGEISLDFWSPAFVELEAHLLMPSYRESWIALHRLINRGWWTRAWVVQEVMVARCVSFLCGGESASWNELGQAVTVAYHTVYHSRLLIDWLGVNSQALFVDSRTSAGWLVSDREHRVQVIRKNDGSNMLASQYLSCMRIRKCKFAHDKVYAILGLSSITFRNAIEIDYDKPLEHLYKSAVRACVEDGQWDILAHSQHSTYNLQYPSWMPDWRLPQRWSYLHTGNPAGSQKPYAKFSDDLSKFTIKGVVLDEITDSRLEDTIVPGLNRHNNITSSVRWCLRENALMEAFLPATREWSLHTIGRIINLDIQLNVFLKMMSIQRNPTSYDQGWHTKTSLPHCNERLEPPGRHEFSVFQNNLQDWLICKTIFETESYLGLASDQTEPGDLVCLIQGLTDPVILRKSGADSYRYISDAFAESNRAGLTAGLMRTVVILDGILWI